MRVDIKNRFYGSIIASVEIGCGGANSENCRLGLAIKSALSSGVDLSRADLSGADLSGADLSGADLSGADLSGADLSRANLSGADLSGANLTGADLSRANLSGADLAGAYLAGANLTGANLARADLAGANLAGANLTGAKWNSEITINRAPLQLYHLTYPVIILDEHMQIGCELHSLKEWAEFDDERIARMDGLKARRFWDKMKAPLLALAEADGRRIKEKQE